MPGSVLEVGAVRCHTEDRARLYCATVTHGADHHELWFKLPADYHGSETDAFLILNLLPAMYLGSTLRMSGPVSPKLLGSTESIQDIFHTWDRGMFKRIPIEAETEPPTAPDGPRGVGCFFTGGVDSFYSLLKHLPEITHIIYVWGFDVLRDNAHLRPVVANMLREVASHYGKTLLEVDANLRDRDLAPIYRSVYSGLFAPFSHGAGLAAVGTLFARQLRLIYIPSSHTYADAFQWGSHPLVDPLWSSEVIQFVHDGAEATRFDKLAKITESQDPLRWLRVCGENRGLAYNCGTCEKCLHDDHPACTRAAATKRDF